MIRRGIPQRPLVGGFPEVVLLCVLLTLIYVRSCQAPMKLYVFKPPTHILVTEILFCYRIRTSRSAFREAVGERRATPRTPDWHYGEKLVIKKLDGKVADRKSYVPSLRYSAHMGPQLPSLRMRLPASGQR